MDKKRSERKPYKVYTMGLGEQIPLHLLRYSEGVFGFLR